MAKILPEFKGARDGSGCDNPDCDASGRYIRVLSEHEMDRTYPQKSDLPNWPLPPQATHICDRCGFVYQGVAGQVELGDPEADTSSRPDVNLEEWDFDPDAVFDVTVRESIEAAIRGSPDGASMREISEVVERYVPGAGVADAEMVADEMDVDVTVHDASEYM